jgi:hypothetical protein
MSDHFKPSCLADILCDRCLASFERALGRVCAESQEAVADMGMMDELLSLLCPRCEAKVRASMGL